MYSPVLVRVTFGGEELVGVTSLDYSGASVVLAQLLAEAIH